MAVSRLHGDEKFEATAVSRSSLGRRRLPLTATGVFLLLMSALVGGLVFARAGGREPVLVAARDIAAGQTIGGGDVRVARVGLGDGVVAVPAGSVSRVVGKVAQAPIAAGSVLSFGQVGDRVVLPAGRSVVGVLLGPGALPVPDVAPSDRVQVVVTPSHNGADDAGVTAGPLGDAVVWRVWDPSAVSRDGNTNVVASGTVVSLLIDAKQAASVASAAASDRIRLVLLGGAGS